MKKNILLTIITLVAAIVMTSCDNREYSKELANQASREAKLVNIHQHPVDGEIANGILKFRCVDSFYVDWAEQHFAGTHFCNSQYQIYGAESNTIASLEGCYDVDANGNIVGTELSLSFIRDEVEQALATFRGIDDPVDFSRRISETDTCHYEPFKACFDKTNRRMTVYGLGEHGDTEFPVNSIANVSGIPLYDFFALENQDGYEAMLAEIQEDVRTSAYEIIKKKGATYYGIAMAVGKICRSIVSDEKSMLPVSVELEGEYGLSGLSISVPCIVGKNGVEQILEMPLNVQERRELKKSADSLKKVIASIDQ